MNDGSKAGLRAQATVVVRPALLRGIAEEDEHLDELVDAGDLDELVQRRCAQLIAPNAQATRAEVLLARAPARSLRSSSTLV